jgi:hypothetical protein
MMSGHKFQPQLEYPQTVTLPSNWFANRVLLWPNRGCRAVSCFSR